MTRWIDNNYADRLYMIGHIAELKNIAQEAVEKDWWVSTVLKSLFSLSVSKYLLFKGGTSLSKGWNIINRFSEDIDIALYKDFFFAEKHLACAKCDNNNQIKMLRKASRDFVVGELKKELEQKLTANRLPAKVEAVSTRLTGNGEIPIDHDADPTVLLVHYPSIFKSLHTYVKPVVKIEISCLSMREPFEIKHITSLINEHFGDEDSDTYCDIATVSPSRTFLEKAFLLNEEFQRNNPRTLRMSRHLYDLERLMDTEYGKSALNNSTLYSEIIEHRKKFYHLGGIDYSLNEADKITFCPTGDILQRLRSDYEAMQSSFIYGNPLDFDALMLRLNELQCRFRQMVR